MTRALLLVVALAGCYAPEERDCTVSCSAAKDCIGDQVCGTDHFCAAPTVAGHCSAVDASVPPQSDAPEQKVTLMLDVMGGGTVDVEGASSCTDHCMMTIPAHVMRTLTATANKPDKPFQMWMDGCSGNQPTCTINPTANLHVGAKFE